MSAITERQAVIEYLAAENLDLEARIKNLEATNRQLVQDLADYAFERAAFGTLAERWLLEVGTSRKSVDKIRGELQRYTAFQVGSA